MVFALFDSPCRWFDQWGNEHGKEVSRLGLLQHIHPAYRSTQSDFYLYGQVLY